MSNNRREKKKKKKILLGLFMILFVGIVLTASTYAWFTANQTVTVQQIDINVAAANGLQLSVDGSNWKPYIAKDEILGANSTYPGAINQVPDTMVPVSTVGATDNSTGFMNMYLGTVVAGNSGTNILTATKTTETVTTSTSGDFVAFDLFFKVTEGNDIYLTNNSSVSAISSSKGIENSARVAFILEGTSGAESTLSTIQAMKSPQTPIIWEPNNNAHTANAIAHARDVYGEALTSTQVVGSYYGVKGPIDSTNNVGLASRDATYFSVVTPAIKTGTSGIPTSAYAQAFHLDAGVTKVRIYMWIEGQDYDCEDAASGSDLSYNLQFSILDKA